MKIQAQPKNTTVRRISELRDVPPQRIYDFRHDYQTDRHHRQGVNQQRALAQKIFLHFEAHDGRDLPQPKRPGRISLHLSV